MNRIIGWLAGVVREPHTGAEVHFHTGPEQQPSPCFNEHCGNPKLDI